MLTRGQEQPSTDLGSDTLRILTVGAENASKITGALEMAGHSVVPVMDLAQATEALLLQRFAAVLLTDAAPHTELHEFLAAVRELDRRASGHGRTPVFLLESKQIPDPTLELYRQSGIDGVVIDSTDADSLTLAIARLAAAVSVDKGASTVALAPELPVLQVEELQEQVAFDNELLLELIELYITERARQSMEMKEALAQGEWDRLSRIAHTIKGSLGSLHALAAHATAQALEMAARDSDASACADFLPTFEDQLDLLETHLLALRRKLNQS